MNDRISVDKRQPPKVASKRKRSLARTPNPARTENIDLREQLVNSGEIGAITEVSLSTDLVTSLRGVLLDVDPKALRPNSWVSPKSLKNPVQFYKRTLRPMLDRHPVLQDAEVRMSGTGLHVIIWFKPYVELATVAERQRWAAAVKVVQRVLPTDPNCPGITAMTRPVGSINGKNGAVVEQLRAGIPVSGDAVLKLFDDIRNSPFRTIANILFGPDLAPCPICLSDNSRLGVLDKVGSCYGHCGKVGIADLFDVFFKEHNTKPAK